MSLMVVTRHKVGANNPFGFHYRQIDSVDSKQIRGYVYEWIAAAVRERIADWIYIHDSFNYIYKKRINK